MKEKKKWLIKDITMPGLGCSDFGLDFIDHAGDQQLGVHDTLLKREEKEGIVNRYYNNKI